LNQEPSEYEIGLLFIRPPILIET